MDPLDLIEKRIAALEIQVLPKNHNVEDLKSQAITDLLLQTKTMITSALSCREAITSILQQMTVINDFLDPCTGENELEIEAKRHYLLEIYPELMETIKSITHLESLTSYIDSGNILKVADLSDKLEQLTAENLTIYKQSGEVTNNVICALQQYNDITTSIKVLFGQLEKAMHDLEVALAPKVSTEE